MMLQIGEVARLTGLSTKTIRYYERIGLTRAPVRASNGYRVYGPESIRSLKFVRQARALGFSLDEVRALLGLWQDTQRPSREVKALAQQRIAEIDARVQELQALRDQLAQLSRSCQGDHRPDCPILKAIAPAEETER